MFASSFFFVIFFTIFLTSFYIEKEIKILFLLGLKAFRLTSVVSDEILQWPPARPSPCRFSEKNPSGKKIKTIGGKPSSDLYRADD